MQHLNEFLLINPHEGCFVFSMSSSFMFQSSDVRRSMFWHVLHNFPLHSLVISIGTCRSFICCWICFIRLFPRKVAPNISNRESSLQTAESLRFAYLIAGNRNSLLSGIITEVDCSITYLTHKWIDRARMEMIGVRATSQSLHPYTNKSSCHILELIRVFISTFGKSFKNSHFYSPFAVKYLFNLHV